MNTTKLLIKLWLESRTRFTKLLELINESDLSKKINGTPNSVGFLIRHIADIEYLFAKNVFGDNSLKVHAKTIITGYDTGEWTILNELIKYQLDSFDALHSALLKQSDEDWEQEIYTKEFGTKSKSEALGRVLSHTAYHSGQLAQALKYGL